MHEALQAGVDCERQARPTIRHFVPAAARRLVQRTSGGMGYCKSQTHACMPGENGPVHAHAINP